MIFNTMWGLQGIVYIALIKVRQIDFMINYEIISELYGAFLEMLWRKDEKKMALVGIGQIVFWH